MPFDRQPRGSATLSLAIALIFLTAGCGQQDEIEVLTVPKQHVIEQLVKTKFKLEDSDRMLAAIIPGEDESGWYFKVVGPKDRVTGAEKDFRSFVESIRFEDGEPKWTLPDGWKGRRGQGLRRNTIIIPVGRESTLEISVTNLPLPLENREDFLLANVNRWRQQLGLSAIGREELGQQVENFMVDQRQATYLSLVGNRGGGLGGGMDRDRLSDIHSGVPGFGNQPRPAKPQPGNKTVGQSGFDPALFTCEPPEQWMPTALNSIRRGSFQVADGEKVVDITVTSVGGSELANLNRWRDQVGLATLDQAEMDKTLETLDVGDWPGKYVALFGPADASPRKAILGVVLTVNGRPWFFKASGDAKFVERETDRFRAFVQSVQFK